MKDLAKTVGGGALALLAIAAVVLIPILFIRGAVWLSGALYPWLLVLNGITFAITVFVLLPNAVFSSVPRFAGSGMLIASYVFGLTLWVWGLLLTYTVWGGLGLFIGLCMAGVGVVPLAMLATLFNAMWSELGQLCLGLFMTFGCRLWGSRLLIKAEQNTQHITV